MRREVAGEPGIHVLDATTREGFVIMGVQGVNSCQGFLGQLMPTGAALARLEGRKYETAEVVLER